MIVLIDNYDSFTYNLYQLLGEHSQTAIKVVRNDDLLVEELAALNPSHIVISPGPGRPEEAGITVDLIKELAGRIPIMGICLGHQAICQAYGADIVHAKPLVHGKASTIHVASGSPIFNGLPPLLEVGRYHSLIADRHTLPDDLLVIAESTDGEVMAVKHRDLDLYGLQFHPESILTKQGSQMIKNFIQLGGVNDD